MTSRVALVMAPLLPGIRMGVGNNGLENGGGFKEGDWPQGVSLPQPNEIPIIKLHLKWPIVLNENLGFVFP